MSEQDTQAASDGRTTRGALIRTGGLALAGAAGAGALAGGVSASGRRISADSVLDKWTKTKKARLGVDLSFPPLQFIDPKTKKPSGYMV
jgi:polar amino acid transport system substrate-binding protein